MTIEVQRRSNRPGARTGVFSVETRPQEGDARVFSRVVDLSAQMRVKSTVYAQIPQGANATLSFRSDRDYSQRLGKNDLNALAPYQRLVVLVKREGNSYFLPESATRLRNAMMATMLPEQLPDMWQALESVDLLVFAQDPSAVLLSPRKRKALIQWVKFGGRVLCIGGTDTQLYQNSFLLDILPVEILGTDDMEFGQGESRSAFRVTRMELKPGASTLWEAADGRPMVARWRVGKGEVAFSAVNLDRTVAPYAPMVPMVWDAMVYGPTDRPHFSFSDEAVDRNIDFAFGRAASLPSLILVFILLGTYTALVGPVNFIMLKKRRRLELAWVTIPAVVAVFSVLTYFIGATTKGGLMILREMDMVSVPAGEPLAEVTKVSSLFSPKKRSYDIVPSPTGGTLTSFSTWGSKMGDGFLMNPFGGMQSTSTGEAGWTLAVSQSQDAMILKDRLFGQWTSQSFIAGSTADLGGAITGKAVIDDGNMVIEVANDSQIELQNAFVRVGDVVHALSSFKPGETATCTLPLERTFRTPEMGWGSGNEIMRASMDGWVQAAALPLTQQDNAQAVSAFLRSRVWNCAFDPKMSPTVLEQVPMSPYLVGWTERSPAPLVLDVEPDEYAYGGMIVTQLPLELGSGYLTITPDLCRTELVNFETDDEVFADIAYENGMYAASQGRMTFVCSPGVRDSRFQLQSVDMGLNCSSTEGYNITLSGFNFQSGRWEVLRQDMSASIQSEPVPLAFCNPADGSVFLQVNIRPTAGIMVNRPANVAISNVRAGFRGRVL